VAATAYDTAVDAERRDSLKPERQGNLTPLELFGPRKDGPPRNIDRLYTESENRLTGFAIDATKGLDETQKRMFFQRWNSHAKTLKDRSASYLAGQQRKFRDGVLATQYSAFDNDVTEEASAIEKEGQSDDAPPEVVADRAANAYTDAMKRLNAKLVGNRETVDGPLVGGLQHLGASAKELSSRHIAAERRLASAAIRAWYNAHSDDVQALEQLTRNDLPNARLSILFNKLDQKGRDALASDLFRDRTALNKLKDDKAKADRQIIIDRDLKSSQTMVHGTFEGTPKEKDDELNRLIASPNVSEAMKKQLRKTRDAGDEQFDDEGHVSLVQTHIDIGDINSELDLALFVANNDLRISTKTARSLNSDVKNRVNATYRRIAENGRTRLGVLKDTVGPIAAPIIDKVKEFEVQFSQFFEENPGVTKEILQEKANDIITSVESVGDPGALRSIVGTIDYYREQRDKPNNNRDLRTAFQSMKQTALDANLITPGEAARFEFGQGKALVERIIEALELRDREKK